ncbi:hypothetical protein BJY59DRAFT_403646 [Rhodotorula toruloides]
MKRGGGDEDNRFLGRVLGISLKHSSQLELTEIASASWKGYIAPQERRRIGNLPWCGEKQARRRRKRENHRTRVTQERHTTCERESKASARLRPDPAQRAIQASRPPAPDPSTNPTALPVLLIPFLPLHLHHPRPQSAPRSPDYSPRSLTPLRPLVAAAASASSVVRTARRQRLVEVTDRGGEDGRRRNRGSLRRWRE